MQLSVLSCRKEGSGRFLLRGEWEAEVARLRALKMRGGVRRIASRPIKTGWPVHPPIFFSKKLLIRQVRHGKEIGLAREAPLRLQ